MAAPRFNLPLLQSFRPRSFAERGLAVPFTTPVLLGARLRLARPGLEILVPNPSGGRGLYLLPWADINALCRPTMHDTVLGQALAQALATDAFSPAVLEAVVAGIASHGLAGEAVAACVRAEAAVRLHTRTETRLALLRGVTAQVEATSADWALRQAASLHSAYGPLEAAGPAELEARGLQALTRLAERWNCEPSLLVDRMHWLASLAAEVTAGGDGNPGPLARLPGILRELQTDLRRWAEDPQRHAPSQPQSENDASGSLNAAARAAILVAHAAQIIAEAGQKTLAAAQACLADPCAALRASLIFTSLGSSPLSSAAALEDMLTRPAWVLDGWAQIVRTWRAAPAVLSRSQALHDMARQVPTIPEEIETWLGLQAGVADQFSRALQSGSADLPSDPAWGISAHGAEQLLMVSSARIDRLEQVRGVALPGAA